MFKYKLSNILKSFTKLCSVLEKFIAQQEKEIEESKTKINDLVEVRKEAEDACERARRVL